MRRMILPILMIGFAASAQAQWTEPQLMPPPINVNPPCQYYYSTISADGRVLCMTLDCGGPNDDEVYISEMQEDSTWTVPLDAGPGVNTNQRNLSPSITIDRQRLYYVSWTGTSYQIFVSYHTGPQWNDWSVGEPLPFPVHRGDEFTAQILPDDSTLIFASTYRDPDVHVYGQYIMYTSRLRPDSSWSVPVLIAPHLNWMNAVYHPCLTDSGRILVYGQFAGPNRQDDIFYAVRNDTGFGPAIRCDSTINSPFWDSDPSCTADGSQLIFESRRPINGDTNYSVHLYVARRMNMAVPAAHRFQPAHGEMIISPSFGTSDTQFSITLPDRMKGQTVRVINIVGQTVETLVPSDPSAETYLWKRASHASVTVSSGLYFFVANKHDDAVVGKVVILR
jgi:hypothetical protein